MDPTHLRIEVGDLRFVARLETALAPLTCAAFLRILPFEDRLIQTRWSGESAWIPMGDRDLGVGVENATSTPDPGQILLYPRAISETEILFPYGVTRFASVFGPLAGNHFLTLTEGMEQLREVGRRVLYDGAQRIRFEARGQGPGARG
jgi:hypothetical protein